MEIYFENAKLHQICCSRAELDAAYGSRDAAAIALCLTQLSAVACLQDLSRLLVLGNHAARCGDLESRSP